MLSNHQPHRPSANNLRKPEDSGLRMTMGDATRRARPPPKPFEQKACLIAERLQQLGKELTLPETTEARAAQINARIVELGRRADWLLGGEFEQGVCSLRDGLLGRVVAGKALGAVHYSFACRALRGVKGLPAPATSAISLPNIPQAFMPSQAAISPEVITGYLRYLSSIPDAASLRSSIRALCVTAGEMSDLLNLGQTRAELGLFLGGLRMVLLQRAPRSREAQGLLPPLQTQEADLILAAANTLSPFGKAAALWTLGSQISRTSGSVVPPQLESLATAVSEMEEPFLKSAAAVVFAQTATRSGQKSIDKLLKDPDASVRCISLRMCALFGRSVSEGTAMMPIEALLSESHTEQAIAAAEAGASCLIGCSGPAVSRLAALAANSENEPGLRASALRALERTIHTDANEVLFGLLSSDDDEVAAAAAQTLAKTPIAALRQRLVVQAQDGSQGWGARKYAVQALGRKTTREEQSILLGMMTGPDSTAALDAAQCLADAEVCHVRPALLRFAEQELPTGNPVRAFSAIISFGKVRTVEERILLLKALQHSFPVVRQAAAEVLLRTGSDALDSANYLTAVRDVVLAASKEGIAREEELAGAVQLLFIEAGLV